jgi:superfamily II DNA or RNA helicase
MIIQNNRPTWDQLMSQAVPSSKNGIYYIDNTVKYLSEKYSCGFYFFTYKDSYKSFSYKSGQTKNSVVDRLCQERSSATKDEFLIVGWIASDLAKISNSDYRILLELHNQKKCTLDKVLNPKMTAREWAVFPDDNPEEIWREYLGNNANRSDIVLTIWQLEAMDQIFSFLGQGKKKIIAELAARFGKTILFLSTFAARKQQVMVVGSYYLTALSSFKKESLRYQQFDNFKCLELKSETFQQDFNRYIEEGKRIVVLSSLCGDKSTETTIRNQNAAFIEQFTDKLTVIDEADYGAHTPSCAPFVNKIGSGAPIILTTGTNSERACDNHNDIDAFLRGTYLDMIMKVGMKEKIKNPIVRQYKRAVEFEKNIAMIKFYLANYSQFVPLLDGHPVNHNPSYAKCSRDVSKNCAFWSGLYKSMIGQHEIAKANDFSIFNRLEDDTPKSVLQFVNMNNAQLKKLETIARAYLSDFYDVYAVCGEDIQGKDAEQFVSYAIRIAEQKGKHVWIIASQMCQRSFSIPEINVVILTYDNGDLGATIQKISRALTNGNHKKTGHIISMSIDGNRDDKIMSIILEAAKQVAEHEDVDIVTGLKKVNRTTSVFQLDEDGYNLQLDVDDYSKHIFSSNNSHRILINNDRLYYAGILDEIGTTGSGVGKQKVAIPFQGGNTYLPSANKKTKKVLTSEESKIISERKRKLDEILYRMEYCIEEIRKHKTKITYDSFLNLCSENEFILDSMTVTSTEFDDLIKENYINLSLLPFFVECAD